MTTEYIDFFTPELVTFFFSFVTEDQTQGLTHAKYMLYCRATSSARKLATFYECLICKLIRYLRTQSFKQVFFFHFSFFFGGTGVLNEGLKLDRKVLYHLSHSFSHFFVLDSFKIWSHKVICLGWL
jgi:hypothetical protein